MGARQHSPPNVPLFAFPRVVPMVGVRGWPVTILEPPPASVMAFTHSYSSSFHVVEADDERDEASDPDGEVDGSATPAVMWVGPGHRRGAARATRLRLRPSRLAVSASSDQHVRSTRVIVGGEKMADILCPV